MKACLPVRGFQSVPSSMCFATSAASGRSSIDLLIPKLWMQTKRSRSLFRTLVGMEQAPDNAGPANSSSQAAQVAARLANDKCERLHKTRPFTPGQHAAVLEGDVYRWGRLDERGPGGMSALVTFAPDGSNPKVEV